MARLPQPPASRLLIADILTSIVTRAVVRAKVRALRLRKGYEDNNVDSVATVVSVQSVAENDVATDDIRVDADIRTSVNNILASVISNVIENFEPPAACEQETSGGLTDMDDVVEEAADVASTDDSTAIGLVDKFVGDSALGCETGNELDPVFDQDMEQVCRNSV